MSTTSGASCCVACSSSVNDTVFTNHLNNCLKNLEGEYEVIRRHRDQLLQEVDDLKRLEAERVQITDSMHKLSNELTQLRLENKAFRVQEERLLTEQKRQFVPRCEYERLMEEHKRMLQELTDLECKDKLFNEVSLRSARLQAQVTNMEAEVSSNRGALHRLEESNRALLEEARSLREANVDLAGRLHSAEAELGPARTALAEQTRLRDAHTALQAAHTTAATQVAELTSKVQSQEALVVYLTEQLGDKGAARGEAERARRELDRALAELQTARTELGTCAGTLRARTTALEQAQEQLATERAGWQAEAAQLRADAARQEGELAGARRALDATHAQAESLAVQLQEQVQAATTARAEAAAAQQAMATATAAREALERRVADLEARVCTQAEREGTMVSASGKSAAELERTVAGLRKELCVEQLANKRLSSALTDCRADREAAVAVYRKLQARYGLVKQEFERVRTANSALQRDTAQLAQLQQAEVETAQRAAVLAEEIQQLRAQLTHARQELARREQELDAARVAQSSSAEGLVGEARRLAEENASLRADLAQVMASFDKLKLLADHYKAQLADAQTASGAAHTCAKGRRCPCKSRPPPPTRWQSSAVRLG